MATVDQSQSSNNSVNNIQEVLPVSLQYNGASMSSTITQRVTSKFFPVGTDEYKPNGQKTIQFRLSSSHYIDPQTACLNFKIKTSNPGVMVDDLITSIFQRVSLKVGGVQVESIDNFGPMFAHLFYSSCSEDYVKHYGNASLGCYRHVPEGTATLYNEAGTSKWHEGSVDTATNVPFDTLPCLGQLTSKNSIPTWSTNQYYNDGFDISLNLSFLFGFFRTSKLIPLRNLGECQIEIVLAEFENCCVQSTPIHGNNTLSAVWGLWSDPNQSLEKTTSLSENYTVSNLSISTDVCHVDPTYTALMDNLVASEQGIMMPYETYSVSLHQMNWQTEHTILISKGCSHLKSVFFFMKPSKLVTSRWNWKNDSYYMNRVNNYQFTIGSDVFPLNRVESEVVALQELSKALGHLYSTQRSSLINKHNYIGRLDVWDKPQQAEAKQLNGAGDPMYAMQPPNVKRFGTSLGSIGLNTERVINAGSQTLSGINSKLRGYNIQLRVGLDIETDGTKACPKGGIYNQYYDYPWTQLTDKSILGYATIHQDKILIIKQNAVAVSD